MSAAVRLGPATLAALPRGVRRPAFERGAMHAGIVHLGLGAFARAHLAAIHDDALEAGPAADAAAWGLHGVSLRSAAVHDTLTPQHGLYSLTLRDAHETRMRVIGSVLGCSVAAQAPAAEVARIAHPHTRIVSLTVTEKGYARTGADALLDVESPDIAHDFAHPQTPRSTIGLIVRGLQARHAAGGAPLTLLSLDNLPSNGHTLRALVLQFAQRAGDAAVERFIERDCTFPNSMVDRIVPRATDATRADARAALGGIDDAAALAAEPFLAWAVEDRFAAGRPDWRAGGAQFVADAAPFEALKLRLLNGAHSAIAYLGALAGWATVDEAMAQPALAGFIDALLRDEVAPTVAAALPAGFDLAGYRAQLLRRFANPALGHRCLQIAMDGSQKLPQRWLNTVRDRLAAGAPIDRLGLALAAWCVHLRGKDDAGRVFAIDDPLADDLRALHARAMAERTSAARADAFTRHPLFGDLAGEPRLAAALARGLDALHAHGAAGALSP